MFIFVHCPNKIFTVLFIIKMQKYKLIVIAFVKRIVFSKR